MGWKFRYWGSQWAHSVPGWTAVTSCWHPYPLNCSTVTPPGWENLPWSTRCVAVSLPLSLPPLSLPPSLPPSFFSPFLPSSSLLLSCWPTGKFSLLAACRWTYIDYRNSIVSNPDPLPRVGGRSEFEFETSNPTLSQTIPPPMFAVCKTDRRLGDLVIRSDVR